MPYIPPEDRYQFDRLVDDLGAAVETDGELAYVISRLIHVHIYEHQKDQSYSKLAEVLHVLDTCKFEYYLNTMKPYEDYKKQQNGDLFDHYRDEERPTPDPDSAEPAAGAAGAGDGELRAA